ncbi:uncharacterized protein G2W53_027047 [Senna tora]|uniref:Uncharacterized protein n=1 Tax=Senna tora TaxID=362788 RepID=A0A834TG73_9FABA|nr:uncharacterized protein G2W53_027047 [Senna tora]
MDGVKVVLQHGLRGGHGVTTECDARAL